MTLSAYSAAKSMETSVGLKARCDLAAAKAGLPFGWINDHWRSFWSRDDWSAAWTTSCGCPSTATLPDRAYGPCWRPCRRPPAGSPPRS